MKRFAILRPLAGILTALMLTTSCALALTVEEAVTLVEDHYVDAIPADVYNQTTVDGVFDVLGDIYTYYMTEEEYAAFQASFEDESVVGIGVVSTITEEGALVEQVYDGSGAHVGGIVAGDLIVAVDGTSLAGLSSDEMVVYLRGEDGSQVEVTYLRDGTSYTVVLTRGEVVIPNTTYELLDGHIGYIECYTFGEDTVTHFDEALAAYGGSDRWIVNLMGNGGGYVNYAVDALVHFTGSGYAGFLENADGKIGAYVMTEGSTTLSPVIVLTDSASASASELYAAAVRDLNAGIVIGWRTYGKGIAQVLLDESTYPEYFDGDAAKITTYRFYSADGSTTNVIGVIPHLMVDPNIAQDVAVLLAGEHPSGNTEGFLRVNLNWRWYMELDVATSAENVEALEAMLEALPSTATLWLGTGGSDGWESVTVEELVEQYDLTIEDRSFLDTEDSPYAQEIDLLATYYLVSGDANDNFNPTQEMTRSDLCTMLTEVLSCYNWVETSLFDDVDINTVEGQAINTLARMGLVHGVGGGLFAPDQGVTQQELITILGRLADYLNMDLSAVLENVTEEQLADESLDGYSTWAKEYVWLFGQSQVNIFGITNNLLWDEVSAIDPEATATKEVSAYLMYSLLSYIDVLPS